MISEEIDKILKSPITQSAKGRFISIEQLEQIKNKLKESEQKSNLTFDECIKEWKKRGWEYCYDDYYNWHCFTNKKENDTISIDSKDNRYWTSEMTFIDIKLNNLIHKTLKALEVENEYSKIYDKKD